MCGQVPWGVWRGGCGQGGRPPALRGPCGVRVRAGAGRAPYTTGDGAVVGTDGRKYWPVTPRVRVPERALTFSFSRSGGAGGQNVNKVATKAEGRFDMHVAMQGEGKWLPVEVGEALARREAARVNKSGEFVVTAQEHREQGRNRAACVEKIQAAVDAACRDAYPAPPNEGRLRRKGMLAGKANQKRLQAKKAQKAKKINRGGGGW